MPEFSRRHLLVAGATAGAALVAGGAPAILRDRTGERVLVVGAGPAGAAAAIALRGAQPKSSVLLVERDPTQLRPGRPAGPVSGPLAGAGYGALAAAGVSIAVDEIRDIDWQRGMAAAISGRSFAFDRIVVAPGVAARDEGIEGYGRDAAEAMPHGWFGTTSIRRLAAQIRAMAEGGTVAIRIPPGRMRFPDGAFLRAAEIARYLARDKPGSTVVLLDHGGPGEDRAADLVRAFGRNVEYVSGESFGPIERVDAATRTLYGSSGRLAADVVNFIPAQMAGEIALRAGLADATGWCPVEAGRQASRLQPRAVLVGDAVAGVGSGVALPFGTTAGHIG